MARSRDLSKVLSSSTALATDAEIAATYATKAEFPSDGWTSFTPTVTSLTIGNGTFVCKYKQIGKIVFASYRFIRGSTSSFANGMTFSLPVAASAPTDCPFMASLIDINGSYSIGFAWFNSTTSVQIWTTGVGATFQNWAYVNNTDPFTWQTGDIITFNLFYEAL